VRRHEAAGRVLLKKGLGCWVVRRPLSGRLSFADGVSSRWNPTKSHETGRDCHRRAGLAGVNTGSVAAGTAQSHPNLTNSSRHQTVEVGLITVLCRSREMKSGGTAIDWECSYKTCGLARNSISMRHIWTMCHAPGRFN
jgi:hypothetical protein